MGLKSFLKSAYRWGRIPLLCVLISANVVAYRTLWRTYHTQGIVVKPDTPVLQVARGIEGKSLEDQIREVIDEHIDFDRDYLSEGFKEKLFDYLEKEVGDVKGQSLTLEEKIMYAQMFSSTLKYDKTADFIDYVIPAKKEGAEDPDASPKVELLKKSLESAYEFVKLNLMDPEEIVDYGTGLCAQRAKVFKAAFHAINDSSTNREDISVGSVWFAQNHDKDFGRFYNAVLSVINATLFAEYRVSLPHVVNLVATEDKFYLIDASHKVRQNYSDSPVAFSWEGLDINIDYASKLK